MKLVIHIVVLFAVTFLSAQQKIDRKSVVSRHNVIVTSIDTLASLTVGNGTFAVTVDATGLQSFPDEYENGIPLGTLSDWGWDSPKNINNYRFEETLEPMSQNGRQVLYATQKKAPQRTVEAANWFRENAHRVHLGNLGFEFYLKNGDLATSKDLKNIEQILNLWTGEIESSFTIEDVPVKVWTAAHQKQDAIGVRVSSPLLEKGQLKVRMRIPFPTAAWMDNGTNWHSTKKHSSKLKQQNKNQATITHKMDSITYTIGLKWAGKAKISKKEAHYYLLTPAKNKEFSFVCQYAPLHKKDILPSIGAIANSSINGWKQFWESGASVDFGECTDSRAFELERRVVLSQYLTKLQCTGTTPPQETGLTFNSWYGKPHLEMHWWHGVHFALWGRANLLENSMPWYNKAFGKAKKQAERQGFDGVRWQKMTDPDGNETASSIGSYLIWQQPHFITFAELLYRNKPDASTLERYKKRVFATADFMASYAYFDKEKQRYILGPGLIPAQECFKATETFNPSYELSYWHWALTTALDWKKRLGEPTIKKWEDVLINLSPLATQGSVYLATESAPDSYTNERYKTDHPAVLGTFGMLPQTPLLDADRMRSTFDLVWKTWYWEETWGWDFPMTAMTAARLNLPEKAVEALLMDITTNTYLPNGHNYQDKRLRLYLPGNGGVLTAVSIMCAGWDGNTVENPGFPKDGKWNVKWEGLKKMF